MERVRRRIKDKRVLALVKAFLKARVMTAVNYFEDSLAGTAPRAGSFLHCWLISLCRRWMSI